jgi:hypothetical protein
MTVEIVDAPDGERGRYGAVWEKLVSLPAGKALKITGEYAPRSDWLVLAKSHRNLLTALRMRVRYRWPDGSMRFHQVTTYGERPVTRVWLAPAVGEREIFRTESD